MNKRKLLIMIVSAVAVFILLVVILFLNSYFNSKNTGPKTSLAPTPVVETKPGNNQASTSTTPGASGQPQASNRAQLKELIKKEIEGAKNTSPKTVADVYKSVDDCAKLSNEADKNVCVTLWAEYAKDPNVCLKVSFAAQTGCQNRSYITKAIAQKNISLCTSVIGADAKRICIDQVIDAVGLTEKDCASLPVEEDKLCLIKILIAKAKSVADCNNITDAGIKEICQNNFYANLSQ
jgi:hypothetical protein